jgi:hypothetical protein
MQAEDDKITYRMFKLKIEISNLMIEYNNEAKRLGLPFLCLKRPRKKKIREEFKLCE